MKPLHNRIVVKRVEAETKTDFGIILTKTDPVDQCLVIAIGDDVKEVKVGDIAIVGRSTGQAVKHEDQNLIVITEDDVLAIIEE
jgi:chaperonin GroES